MAQGIKFFMINKESNWKYKNILSGIRFEDDTLVFDSSQNQTCAFISSAMDSGENETVWHRLTLRATIPENSNLKITLYASDNTEFILNSNNKNKNHLNFNNFLLNKNEDINIKINTFLMFDGLCFNNPSDVLLFKLKGRYLWMCIEAQNHESDKDIKINHLKIEFPHTSLSEYLPEIYQRGDRTSFFFRFLAIFQSMYNDIDDKIDLAPSNFEPLNNNFLILKWIASWLNTKDIDIWNEEKLRELVSHSVNLFKIKGTLKSIDFIIKKVTDSDSIIIEKFKITENDYYKKEKDLIDLLFGDNFYVFTVLLKEKVIVSSEEYAHLLRIIKSIAPIEAICNLVVLQNSIFLSHHCYLGINSFITEEKYSLNNKEINEETGIVMIG